MYPTIHNFDAAVNPLLTPWSREGTSASSNSNNQRAPTTPGNAQQPPRTANGPPPPPQPAFPTLMVMIDSKYQLDPPVQAPSQPPGVGGPAAGARGAAAPPPPPGQPAPGSMEPLDLALERRLLQELESSSSGVGGGHASSSSGAVGAQQQQQQRDDPYEVLLARYTDMGYSRDDVAMALTIVGPEETGNADKIVDACRKFKKLCSMGFRADHVAGALIMHDGDMEMSTNACLDAAVD